MKLGHLGLGVKDLEASRRFYDAIAPHVGLEEIDSGDTSVRYGENGSALFYIHTRSAPSCNIHLCFEVERKADVDAFYTSAIASGGVDFGKPGIRQDYSPTYYAAFVLDPEGNNIEAVCRG